MKTIKIAIAFLLSLLLYPGCENCGCYCSGYDVEELVMNADSDLNYTSIYCNPEYEISLSFDSLQDSRCPIGAMCIWEGNARIKLKIRQSGESEISFWLNTHDSFLSDTVVNGIRYELIDVLPYPELDKEYQLDDYLLQMRISD